jgi:hypothetical protein
MVTGWFHLYRDLKAFGMIICPLLDNFVTEDQRNHPPIISKSFGKRQSELIRDVIDSLIDQTGKNHKEVVLREAAGIGRRERNLPDFKSIRSEWIGADHMLCLCFINCGN